MISGPPSYEMVVKQEKAQLDDTSDLPTYWQAVKELKEVKEVNEDNGVQ